MIIIKRLDNSEFYTLKTYGMLDTSLKKQIDSNNTSKSQYFAILDKHIVLGHALVRLYRSVSTAEIKEIYILPQYRRQGLGDGLMRTIFNSLRIEFFNYAIIKSSKEIVDFLVSNGAEQLNLQNINEHISAIINKNSIKDYYIYNIEEFFNKKCKGSQRV